MLSGLAIVGGKLASSDAALSRLGGGADRQTLAAAHTEYLFIYVFSDQISDVCQTSDPV